MRYGAIFNYSPFLRSTACYVDGKLTADMGFGKDRTQQVNHVKLESIARSQRNNLHNELLRLVFKIETLSALVLDVNGQIVELNA